MAGKMRRTSGLILLALGVAALGLADPDRGRAQTATKYAEPGYRPAPARRMRTRPRIRVAPAYPYRLYSTTYPVPYEYDFPGPGAVRQCHSWLAPENRASGQVIVPKMHCWWER